MLNLNRNKILGLASMLWKRSLGNATLIVKKDNIGETKILETLLEPLRNGEVRLKVDKFALTANTVTYGKIGTQFGYFDFYPLKEPSWGCVPAIGWATVVESSLSTIPVGGKHFGWYPMSKYCTVEAKASKSGFRDIGSHRSQNAQIYVEHTRTDLDPFRDIEALNNGSIDSNDYDDRQAILRGLFLTSFLADEFLADTDYCGAKSVIIVSASSKTALGIAQRIAAKKGSEKGSGLKVIGVTSTGNADFVRSTHLYDQTVTYDSIEASVSPEDDAVVIDMSGNWKVIESIHKHLGDRIKYSMAIGLSHHDSGYAPKSVILPGPKPALFFAPTEVARRLKEWGPADFHKRSKQALSVFQQGSIGWMDIAHVNGMYDVQKEWMNAYNGKIPPNTGMIASMHDIE
jgi:hypothetical protein